MDKGDTANAARAASLRPQPAAQSSQSDIAIAAAALDAWRKELAVDAVLVAFGSCAPEPGAMIDHYRCEVRADGKIFSARAKYPHDAAGLAKALVKDHREKKKKRKVGEADGPNNGGSNG
ncbi:hypothetical protein WJS89_10420 [Sphingomicrobium sp. XHP0235]|uniref:hypothetical protein n=1 Tax=Sphingomicrobium aquimarinum TaxID=3133971 RepID=UPI0031FEAC0B